MEGMRLVRESECFAKDLRRGQQIKVKIDTPDGPMTIYPKLLRVLIHPSDMSVVRVEWYEPPFKMMPAIRSSQEFHADDLVDLVV